MKRKAFFAALFLFFEAVFFCTGKGGTKLVLPERKKENFFSSIDSRIIAFFEDGSPESLVKILSSLRKPNGNYTDAETVALFCASSVLRICFPADYKNEYAVNYPAELASNSYVGALKFALEGLYDYASGDGDFLSLVLPSLSFCSKIPQDSEYFPAAKKSLESALKKKKDSVLANFLMGKLFATKNQFSEAVAFFDKSHEIAPDSFDITYNYAESLFKSGNSEEADILARSLVSKDSQNRKALKLCAETAFLIGDFDSAETYVARVLQQEPSSAYYLLFRVKILMSKGDYIRAASLLDVYSRTDSESRDYLLLRAKIQKDWNKNIASASATIEKAVSLYSNDTEILLSAAEIAKETGGKIAGFSSGELADEVLKSDSENRSARLLKLNSLFDSRNWSEAYSLGSELMKTENPEDSLIFIFIEICLNSNKKDEAWKIASELYKRKENDENAVESYLRVLTATGKKAEAQKIIEKMLPKAAQKLKSFLFYERSFLQASEEASLSDLRASLTANPRNKNSLFRLYEIYYAKSEYRKAQYYLKQVVALSPNDENLLNLNANLESLLKK